MASVNRVILVGNLGRDPEVRYAPSGDAITNITLATTDQWKDKSGQKQERTEWHRLVFFGRQAEIAGEYLKKGSQVYIEGSLRTRKWTDQSGQERYTTEIVADRMQMLGAKSSGNNGDDQGGASQGSNAPQQGRQNQQRSTGQQQGADRQNQRNQGGGGGNHQDQYSDFTDYGDDIPFGLPDFARDPIMRKVSGREVRV